MVAATVGVVVPPSARAAVTGAFRPLAAPARLLDTRPGSTTVDGAFAGGGVRAAGTVLELVVAGRAGLPADVDAVFLNITAVDARQPGYVTLYPCGQPVPTASTLNYAVGDVVANGALVAPGAGGAVCAYTFGATDLVVDAAGSFPAGVFDALSAPRRLLDTRVGASTVDGTSAGGGTRPAGSTLELQVGGRAGLAPGAQVLAFTVTVDATRQPGFVTAWPCGEPRPTASNLNHAAGVTTATAVVAAVGADGRLCLYTHGATELLVDVTGAFQTGAVQSLPSPRRLLDTRAGAATYDGTFAGVGRLGAGVTLGLPVAGRAGVPADAAAVVLSVTVDAPTAPGFLTVYPAGAARPTASNLNHRGGQTIANLVVARVGVGGSVCIYGQAATDVIVDVAGWLTGPPPPTSGADCESPPAGLLEPPNLSPFPFKLPCNAGPPMEQIVRTRVNGQLRPLLLDAERLLAAGQLERLAYTIMANSGPLPTRVASYAAFTQWVRKAGSTQPVTTLDELLGVVNLAYHETLHQVVAPGCVQTGPTTGVTFSMPLGIPQSEIHADVLARIDAIAALGGDPAVNEFEADSARATADLYLTGDIGAAGFESQLAEMNAYLLAAEWGDAIIDTFGIDVVGPSAVNDTVAYHKVHQLARYLQRASTQPAVWASLRAGGLPAVVAAHLDIVPRIWRVYPSSVFAPQFSWDLVFGPDAGPLAAYTDGAAFSSVPPRPPTPGTLDA